MKRVLIGLGVVLALSSCSLTEPIPVKGEVVDCASIKVAPGKSEPLECLGGGAPIAADSIVGPALVNVWGTWCAPCKQELPHLAHFLQKSDGRVQVIGIAVEEKSQAAVKKFIERNGMTWPVLYDATGSTKSIFGMGGPVTWFIDANGKNIETKIGAYTNKKQLFNQVEKAFGVKL